IEVLDELPYESFAQLSAEETAEKVRKIIVEHVDEHHIDEHMETG
ncbi:MAG: hypothetical protein JRH09_05300, partial [Deltaproteobacteria bacterium]|nr:hypothetical protein [Deltaproteobacteria bacterium]